MNTKKGAIEEIDPQKVVAASKKWLKLAPKMRHTAHAELSCHESTDYRVMEHELSCYGSDFKLQ